MALTIDLIFTEKEIVEAEPWMCEALTQIVDDNSKSFMYDRGPSNRENLRVSSVSTGLGVAKIWSATKSFKRRSNGR